MPEERVEASELVRLLFVRRPRSFVLELVVAIMRNRDEIFDADIEKSKVLMSACSS